MSRYENPCERCGEFAGSHGENYCSTCRKEREAELREKMGLV